jgi:hypothetical protein
MTNDDAVDRNLQGMDDLDFVARRFRRPPNRRSRAGALGHLVVTSDETESIQPVINSFFG